MLQHKRRHCLFTFKIGFDYKKTASSSTYTQRRRCLYALSYTPAISLCQTDDRLKLRSMVVGEKDDRVFIASEEAAVRTMEPNAENIWAPAGGEPVIIKVKDGAF